MASIEGSGFYTNAAFLDNNSVLNWKQYAEKLSNQNLFRESFIGRKDHEIKNTGIRSDKILWIHEFSEETQSIGDWLTDFSNELKKYFRLPLEDIEAHFSIYAAGSRYQKHVDNGTGLNNRLFTFIFYLNQGWKPGDGGELIVYDPKQPEKELRRIEPRGGTFVLFRSDLFHHEVLEAQAPRYTLTGWFRRHARI